MSDSAVRLCSPRTHEQDGFRFPVLVASRKAVGSKEKEELELRNSLAQHRVYPHRLWDPAHPVGNDICGVYASLANMMESGYLLLSLLRITDRPGAMHMYSYQARRGELREAEGGIPLTETSGTAVSPRPLAEGVMK